MTGGSHCQARRRAGHHRGDPHPRSDFVQPKSRRGSAAVVTSRVRPNLFRRGPGTGDRYPDHRAHRLALRGPPYGTLRTVVPQPRTSTGCPIPESCSLNVDPTPGNGGRADVSTTLRRTWPVAATTAPDIMTGRTDTTTGAWQYEVRDGLRGPRPARAARLVARSAARRVPVDSGSAAAVAIVAVPQDTGLRTPLSTPSTPSTTIVIAGPGRRRGAERVRWCREIPDPAPTPHHPGRSNRCSRRRTPSGTESAAARSASCGPPPRSACAATDHSAFGIR